MKVGLTYILTQYSTKLSNRLMYRKSVTNLCDLKCTNIPTVGLQADILRMHALEANTLFICHSA